MIEWTDETWNPVVGCTRVSAGCQHCYAEREARRMGGNPHPAIRERYAGLVGETGHWTGEVRLVPDALTKPLHWRKPRRVFVCSMSDLFHPDVPDTYIASVFGVMAATPQHTYQVLTKRPERMAAWFAFMADKGGRIAFRAEPPVAACCDALHHHAGLLYSTDLMPSGKATWPMANVWLGTSVEDQAAADERIPHLLECPAAVRFLSCEPLLGDINLVAHVQRRGAHYKTLTSTGWLGPDEPRIHWLIAGGESGPGARPCDVAWLRSLVGQCRDAGVPAFVKQLGGNVRDRNDAGFIGGPTDAWDVDYDRVEHDPNGYREAYQGAPVRVHLRNHKGSDMAEWPADLRVRQWPEGGVS